MKTVLLDDKQRNKIIRAVKPEANDYFSYQNLNLLTAVYDEEKNIYLTLSRFMSSAITRTGDNRDEYCFVLLTTVGCFTVSCYERAEEYSGVYSPLPLLITNNKILEMIKYYRESFSERRALQKEAEKDIDTGNKSFTEWYLEQYYFDKKSDNCNSGTNTDEKVRDSSDKRGRIRCLSRISFGLAVVSLIIGASFHGFRLHPENAAHYNIGVTMGVTMIVAFAFFMLIGIILYIFGKRK